MSEVNGQYSTLTTSTARGRITGSPTYVRRPGLKIRPTCPYGARARQATGVLPAGVVADGVRALMRTAAALSWALLILPRMRARHIASPLLLISVNLHGGLS